MAHSKKHYELLRGGRTETKNDEEARLEQYRLWHKMSVTLEKKFGTVTPENVDAYFKEENRLNRKIEAIIIDKYYNKTASKI